MRGEGGRRKSLKKKLGLSPVQEFVRSHQIFLCYCSISYESKLVIKLKDVEEETPVPELMPIGEDGFTGWGDEAFHCNIDVGTWDEDKLFGSGKKAAGPCCHTPFAINRREVNETFQCYYSFDTSYCNNELVTLSTDDDFRGMAKNTNENLDNAENLVSDVVNSMCCSEEVPSSVGAAMLMFVLACTIAAITLWCVFFRLKVSKNRGAMLAVRSDQ